tara:strand:+ start:217 stop:1149 length:933 start_codon:yes stop_codon:yes gene_type:complete
MGILRSEPQAYYASGGDHGSYRYIPLSDVIDSFTATYVGEGKLCENVVLNDVTFHAIRALQELSYDTFKCTKDMEVTIPSSLVLVMPLDYINYVSVQWVDGNGIFRRLYPSSKTGNPFTVEETIQSHGGFATDGANQDLDRAAADSDNNFTSTTFSNFKSLKTSDLGDYDADDLNREHGELVGNRYGIDPQYAQVNGTFFVDELQGKFHFSSSLNGKTVVLKYISDGVSSTSNNGIDLTTSLVPKLAEEAIYKHILYGVLSARKDTPGGTLASLKKERYAETRKAKLRLSNIKLEELTQVLRGSSKIIKH